MCGRDEELIGLGAVQSAFVTATLLVGLFGGMIGSVARLPEILVDKVGLGGVAIEQALGDPASVSEPAAC